MKCNIYTFSFCDVTYNGKMLSFNSYSKKLCHEQIVEEMNNQESSLVTYSSTALLLLKK